MQKYYKEDKSQCVYNLSLTLAINVITKLPQTRDTLRSFSWSILSFLKAVTYHSTNRCVGFSTLLSCRYSKMRETVKKLRTVTKM